MNSGVK